MPALSSNLYVFVSFKEDTIFAGEDIEATIIFKNVEPPKPAPEKTKHRVPATVPPIHESPASTLFPSSQPASRPAHSRHTSSASQGGKGKPSSPHTRRTSQFGHRQTLSLNQLDTNPSKNQAALPHSAGTAPATPRRGSRSHGRSVSIVSISGDVDAKSRRASGQREAGRPELKLSRSASVQVTPTTGASPRWSYSASNGGSKPASSPLATATSAPDGFPWGKSARARTIQHTRHASANNDLTTTPRITSSNTVSGRTHQNPILPPSSFKFPPSPGSFMVPPSEISATPHMDSVEYTGVPNSTVMATKPGLPPASSIPSVIPSAAARLMSPEHRPPLNRVFSLSSEAGTPRSSTEIYSSSNHSDETATSEIPSVTSLLRRPAFFRNPSSLAQMQRRHGPETIMMGFANITGSFRLDGSLVNQSPFEDVKRRAVVGGQGAGGVVGLDQRKGQGGLFGGLSWSGIGESLSLGGILGSEQRSSIREMKNTAESESVPLLSTPKSILFVDLCLAPGESRGYNYSFTLPRGLPPSHRGRAIKVTYQLIIGTQRPGSGRQREQQMREVRIPFRVFGGVDAGGEILGHDLMSPYIILHDQGRSSQLELDANGKATKASRTASEYKQVPKSTENDFSVYVSKLLSSPRRNSSTGLISPNAESFPDSPTSVQSRRPSGLPAPPPPSTRILVDSAIRLSTQPLPQRRDATATTSQTNFTIARAGQPVATLTLSRPALRLGDFINVTLDFLLQSSGRHSTHSRTDKMLVHAIALSLESTELVDPSLAVRSAASIDRATRRVWDRRIVGGSGGAALGWCKRWSGGLKVPSTATPTFSTTGVECRWVVRVEIAVGMSQKRKDGLASQGVGQPHDDENGDSDTENDHQGEGAARRREASEQAEHSNVGLSSSDGTPSQSPTPSHTHSSQKKPVPTRQAPLNRQKSQRQNLRRRVVDEQEQAFARSRQLLERVLDDERGVTLAAVRRVPGDVFEIAVPVRIFGAIGVGGGEQRDVSNEGLPV